MPTLPPVVDQFGNINVHAKEGISVPVVYETSDGVRQDISARTFVFEAGRLKKIIPADPGNPTGKLLTLSVVELRQIPHGSNFVVLDVSANPPIAYWYGVLSKRGG
jgi:histidinol-phosphate/aromatic aminotransferase/cobyric acid decarboxylase-like protein